MWGIANYEHNIAFPKSVKLAERGTSGKYIKGRSGPQGTYVWHGGLQSGKLPVKMQDGDGTGAYNRNHRN